MFKLNIFLLLLICSWFARFEIMKVYYKQQWKSETPTIKVVEEDRKILSQYSIFKPSLGTKDAGSFLNPKIHWPFGEIHHQGELVLPEFVHREMSSDWTNKKPLFKKMGLNFGWMNELHQFDYWDVEKNTPVFVAGEKYLTYSYPSPSYKDLVTWSKLRLLYGKETGKMLEAFKDVRHLARLIWTNDTLLSTMITISLLQLENDIHQGNWEIIPQEVIMRAKRYFYDLPLLVDPRLSDSDFYKLDSDNPGICPMINEGMMKYISMRDLLKDELHDEYERMNNLVTKTKSICRNSIVYEMWADPTWPTFAIHDEDDFSYMSEGKFLPRRTWGELKKENTLKAIMGFILSTESKPE